MVTPRWFIYVIVVVVSLVKLTTMIKREIRGRKWDLEKNFDWYKSQYPKLVGDSSIECYSCSGKNVHLRDMGKSSKVTMNSHICAICGEELYRSVTPR